MYLYVELARQRQERNTRPRAVRSTRAEAWSDYRESLQAAGIPEDSDWRVSAGLFNSIWNQCTAAWGVTSARMRSHGVWTQPRRDWLSHSRRRMFAEQYLYHVVLVVQGNVFDRSTEAHAAHLGMEYRQLKKSVAQAAHDAAVQAQEWRTANSDIRIFCGNVTNIVTYP